MEHREVKQGVLLVLTFAASAAVAFVSFIDGRQRGREESRQEIVAQIKASCDDPEAKTLLDGREYLCVGKEQWNETLNYVYRQGVAAGRQKDI